MTGRVTKLMRTLKALVVGMGILIVVGTAIIAVMIARRGGDSGTTGRDVSTTTAQIALPAGARVVETALDGDRIALRIVLVDGGQRVIIFDVPTGRRVGVVDLLLGREDGGHTTVNP